MADWQRALVVEHGSPLGMLAVSLLLFPKLALGLSGFETGVAVMPLVRGDRGDRPEAPAGRVRNTRRLLLVAAPIMSVFLLTSSFVTITLIPPREFAEGGKANGRALAYLGHAYPPAQHARAAGAPAYAPASRGWSDAIVVGAPVLAGTLLATLGHLVLTAHLPGL